MNFIEIKLKLLLMQNVTKMQRKHIIYSLSNVDLSLKTP